MSFNESFSPGKFEKIVTQMGEISVKSWNCDSIIGVALVDPVHSKPDKN